jgi:His-Xaa-Ser system protein HxsD
MEEVIFTEDHLVFRIDPAIYPEAVLFKALYWLSKENSFSVVTGSDGFFTVNASPIKGSLDPERCRELVAQLNKNLIDFKVRNIVNQETSDIRKMIVAKAFLGDDNLLDGDTYTRGEFF